MAVMLLRGIFFLIIGLTKGKFLIETTSTMSAFLILLGVTDITFALIGTTGVFDLSIVVLDVGTWLYLPSK